MNQDFLSLCEALQPILLKLLQILNEEKNEIKTTFGRPIIPFGLERLKILELLHLCFKIPENYGIRSFLKEQHIFKIFTVQKIILI